MTRYERLVEALVCVGYRRTEALVIARRTLEPSVTDHEVVNFDDPGPATTDYLSPSRTTVYYPGLARD